MPNEIDLSPYIEKFEDFYSAALSEKIGKLLSEYPVQKSLVVDFEELERFDGDIADLLIKQPDSIIDAAEQALLRAQEITFRTVHPEMAFEPHVRFFNLPDTALMIQDISSKNIGELISVKGVVTKRGPILHRVKVAVYACQMCDAKTKVPMTKHAQVPQVCPECKRRALKLEEDDSYFVDIQRAEMQELLERLKGGAPAANIQLWLEDDLVNRITPGETMEITGVMRLKPPQKSKNTGESEHIYTRYIEVVHAKATQREFEEIETNKEEESRIREFASDPLIYDKTRDSIAPGIYGHNEVKEALVLQLFGGTKDKEMPGGAPIRDDIHILLIGDPGSAKTRFLQYVKDIAPKGIYVSGKSVTGVGLTAAAEKDELGDGGWTLKAGALVIASGGIASVDEFDKIDENERAAMHEVMESQSYHYNTELMFPDGKLMKIGEFVESLMEKYPKQIYEGRDCLILQPPEAHQILTTDFEKIFETKISRVSKHKAPEKFVKVMLQTGRELLVTPEHPFWVLEEGEWKITPAEKLKEGLFVPMPKKLDLSNAGTNLPENCQNGGFFRLMGYYMTDGSYELNRGKKNGINFTNKDENLIEDFSEITDSIFGVKCYVQRPTDGLHVPAARAISNSIAGQFQSIEPSLLDKCATRNIPLQVMSAPLPHVRQFLAAAFEGDGSFSKNTVSLVSPNKTFIHQTQILLLRFGIRSHVFKDNKVFRLTINGQNNLSPFLEHIGFISERKNGRLERYVGKGKALRTTTDVVPACLNTVMEILNGLKIKEKEAMGNVLYGQKCGFNFTTKNFSRIIRAANEKLACFEEKADEVRRAGDFGTLIAIRKGLSLSQSDLANNDGNLRHLLSYYELRKQKWALEKYRTILMDCIGGRACRSKALLAKLERLLSSEVGWCRVERIETVKNSDSEWVYDITVEPTKAFISECAVLHNTVSVAKAGIVARFKAKTSILAAANPKFGRFDPNKLPGLQFNIPPTILSRFDLIFPIMDVLDEAKDSALADFMLSVHSASTKSRHQTAASAQVGAIEPMLLRKYVAYARQNIKPRLTPEAVQKIKEFYVELRKRGKSEGAHPITPRQIEGLVRLSEASAKIRLSDTVDLSDAERAIRLTTYVLDKVSRDRETGKLDIDILATGRPKSQVDKINTILTIAQRIQSQLGVIEINRLMAQASDQNIDEITARRIIDDLIYKGELYKVRPGVVKIVEQSG